jgi:hypothetical protein
MDLSNAYAYPVPWKPTSSKTGITFKGLVAGSQITISSIDGMKTVTLGSPDGSDVTWLLKNDSGDNVASGVYIYVIKANSQKKTGKVVIIR